MSDIDRLIAQSDPIGEQDVASLDLGTAEAELVEEIMSTDVVELETAKRRNTFRTRILAGVAGVAAVSLVVGGVLVSGGGGVLEEFSPAAVRVAEANDRLLVTESGWEVTRADEFTEDSGEMTFGNGDSRLDLQWLSADLYEHFFEKYDHDAGEIDGGVEIADRVARLFVYDGTTDYTAVLPPAGAHFTVVRGDMGSLDAYLGVVRSMEAVDVETWLRAMPESVVKPDQRAFAVDEMLAGIPLPATFDPAGLRDDDALKDRYQLGAIVAGAVACGWLDQWMDAKESGDEAAAQEAAGALATSREWPILLEMDDEGAYPEVLWEYADWVTTGKAPGHGSKDSAEQFGRQDYVDGLGCDEPARAASRIESRGAAS